MKLVGAVLLFWTEEKPEERPQTVDVEGQEVTRTRPKLQRPGLAKCRVVAAQKRRVAK